MNSKAHPALRIVGLIILLSFGGLLIWATTRPPQRPSTPRVEQFEKDAKLAALRNADRRDAQLVRLLIEEDLGNRRFRFPVVIGASSGCRVLRLDDERNSHVRVSMAIKSVIEELELELAKPDSPALQEHRINEVSRHFEDALKERLNQIDGLTCDVPKNRKGEYQRSGYPDLEITDQSSGDTFYLDPKLVANDSWDSTFRTFYFEPKKQTLKINKDAVHLLLGISHDGNTGAWKFGPSKLVDLSRLKLRLKPEFQASNADVYPSEAE